VSESQSSKPVYTHSITWILNRIVPSFEYHQFNSYIHINRFTLYKPSALFIASFTDIRHFVSITKSEFYIWTETHIWNLLGGLQRKKWLKKTNIIYFHHNHWHYLSQFTALNYPKITQYTISLHKTLSLNMLRINLNHIQYRSCTRNAEQGHEEFYIFYYIQETLCYLACVLNRVCWLHVSANCMRRRLTNTQYEVKTKNFQFSSCVGVFLGDTVDWRMKVLIHTL
jgi:hypothetical protein